MRSALSMAHPGMIVLAAVVALTACQDIDGARAPALTATHDRPGAAAPAAAQTEYPSLYTVPPRPQLSYSVQQRRAIVDGLVADRELARYTDQVVRYRSGQSSLPPPPEPPREVAAIDTEGLLEPAAPAPVPAAQAPAAPPAPSPYDDDSGFGGFGDFGNDEDEDTLDSFVDDLARDPLEEQADEVGVPGAEQEPADEDDGGLIDWLGGLFGAAEPEDPPGSPGLAAVPAMQPAPGAAAGPIPARADGVPPRPSPEDPGIAVGAGGVAIDLDRESASAVPRAAGEGAARAIILPTPAKAQPERALPAGAQGATAVAASTPAGRILFAPDSAELPAGAGAQLEQVLAEAEAQGAVIRILGEAGLPALALDRARAVGLALVGLGARASDLEMTLAPDARGDQARLLLAGPGSR